MRFEDCCLSGWMNPTHYLIMVAYCTILRFEIRNMRVRLISNSFWVKDSATWVSRITRRANTMYVNKFFYHVHFWIRNSIVEEFRNFLD